MKKILLVLIIALMIGYNLKYVYVEQVKMPKTDQLTENIESYISEMSIEEKIGQMIIMSNRTPNMTPELQNTLINVKPGGFIFFAENFSNQTDSLKLIEEIKATNNIPMFLSIDQEGGRVQRLKKQNDIDVMTIPPMAEIGATNDVSKAFEVGKKIGEDLKKFGLNMDFAPVLDVLTNKENKSIQGRSFGSDYDLVANMGSALAKGLQENNIIPVYKHFPGHGSTTVDSHYDLPVLTKSKEDLLTTDLIPFQKAIEDQAEIIMIGHLAIPNITNDNTPASLSKKIITNLLKKELGFQGLVITDALNMKALTNYYTEQQIYEMAINAGVDILLMPNHPEQAIEYIKKSIQNGTIKEEQINESITKILKLKAKYFNFLKSEE